MQSVFVIQHLHGAKVRLLVAGCRPSGDDAAPGVGLQLAAMRISY